METLSRSQIQVPRLPKDRYLKGVTLNTKFGADELNSVWPRSGSPGCQRDQIYPQSGPLGQVVGITFMKTLAVPLHCESCPLINSASHPKGKNTTKYNKKNFIPNHISQFQDTLWLIALWEGFWSSVFLRLSPYLQVSVLVSSIYPATPPTHVPTLPTSCTHQCTHLSTHFIHPSVYPSICPCSLPTHPIHLLTHPPIYLPTYSFINSPTHPVSFPPSQNRRGFLCTYAWEVVSAASEAVLLVITFLVVSEPFLF